MGQSGALPLLPQVMHTQSVACDAASRSLRVREDEGLNRHYQMVRSMLLLLTLRFVQMLLRCCMCMQDARHVGIQLDAAS